jgi:hypothetical protein
MKTCDAVKKKMTGQCPEADLDHDPVKSPADQTSVNPFTRA